MRADLSYKEDLPVLRHLWRWKVATTATLTQACYANRSAYAAYRRLWNLERARYITSEFDKTRENCIWTLTAKGFRSIRDELPDLKEEGFKSEKPVHDILVGAIHLGAGLFKNTKGVEIFTEQELRRYHPECYPSWVPQSTVHIPDGYWHLSDTTGTKTIALEIELHQKRGLEYERAGMFYESALSVTDILWIVRSPSHAKSIQRSISKVIDDKAPHSFIALVDACNDGWQAKIRSGPQAGKMISEVLGDSGNCPSTGLQQVSTELSLDTRKCPYKSKRSKKEIICKFRNWVGV